MIQLLQSFFTLRSDSIVPAQTVLVAADSPVDALAGDDVIAGQSNVATPDGRYGVILEGNLGLSSGNDWLSGRAFDSIEDTPNQQVIGIALNPSTSSNPILDSGAGDDVIWGRATVVGSPEEATGISAFGSTILTRDGQDIILGEVVASTKIMQQSIQQPEVTSSYAGMFLESTLINTGSGNDRINGKATGSAEQIQGIFLSSNSAAITGSGDDAITGEASGSADFMLGIRLEDYPDQASIIDTGIGKDTITGKATGYATNMIGILLEQKSGITTGSGDDAVIGTASNSNADSLANTNGISGADQTVISTGDGNDKVIARATQDGKQVNGFSGGLTVDLGTGYDYLAGFGDLTGMGGSGVDIYDLRGYRTTDFTITKDGSGGVQLEGFGATANLKDFEVFLFDNGPFSYQTLA